MPKETKNKNTYRQNYTKVWETDSDLKGNEISLHYCHLYINDQDRQY